MTDEATPSVGRVVGGESTSARLRQVERERDKAQHELAHARFEIDKLRAQLGGLRYSGRDVIAQPDVTHVHRASRHGPIGELQCGDED